MNTVYVGGDASKGYADFHAVCPGGVCVWKARLDDTREGHTNLLDALTGLGAERVIVGLESSGGVERNWLRALRPLPDFRVVQVNALAVHKHRQCQLHQCVTDASSARAIAEYLMAREHDQVEYDPALAAPRQLLQLIQQQIKQQTAVKNELQAQLVTSHPELVQFCRSGFPDWLLEVISLYPTQLQLAAADPAELAKIPYLTFGRAQMIVAAARTSVASDSGVATVIMVDFLVTEVRRRAEAIERLEKALFSQFENDSSIGLLTSIPGVGLKSAVTLRLVLSEVSRFRTANAAVAYCGLDPRVIQSGDGCRHLGISRRGNAKVRAILYPAAMAAARGDNTIGDFYRRLVAAGKKRKVALVACMAKMVRLAYACLLRGQSYDPSRAAKQQAQEANCGSVGSLAAPVSRREATRRRRLQMKAATATERGQASKSVVEKPRSKNITSSQPTQAEQRVASCGGGALSG